MKFCNDIENICKRMIKICNDVLIICNALVKYRNGVGDIKFGGSVFWENCRCLTIGSEGNRGSKIKYQLWGHDFQLLLLGRHLPYWYS